MDPGEFKPLLAALALPPAAPLLLAGLGALLLARRRRLVGGTLLGLGLGASWLLACQAVALALAQWLLPPTPPIDLQKLAGVQAIAVLGGGITPDAPDYGAAQPTAETLARLRYGTWLARQSGKPLAFSGGVGSAAASTAAPPEGEVAQRIATQEYGLPLRWVESRSRDTAENARLLRALLQPDGIQHIALVTDATHMTRAALEFRRVGFDVTIAPTRLPAPSERPLLQWLPSPRGLGLSHEVLREWLALRVAGA